MAHETVFAARAQERRDARLRERPAPERALAAVIPFPAGGRAGWRGRDAPAAAPRGEGVPGAAEGFPLRALLLIALLLVAGALAGATPPPSGDAAPVRDDLVLRGD